MTRSSADVEIARHASRLRHHSTCFPYRTGLPAVEFEIIGYYDLGRIWHAGSQDTDLSRHVPIFHSLLHYVITVITGRTKR